MRERGAGQSEVELARLDEGAFFGEMALIAGEPRAATVRAASPCSLLVIDRGALRVGSLLLGCIRRFFSL